MIEIVKDFKNYDEFVTTHKFGNVMQLSNWGKVKEGDWEPNYVVMRDENNNICASALLLVRKFKIYTLMYAPRGYVVDWNDSELVEKFHQQVIQFAKSKKVDTLKVDPSIYFDMSKHSEDEFKLYHEQMLKLGFSKVNDEEAIQLTNQMYIDLEQSEEIIKQNFSKNIKRYLNKFIKDGQFVVQTSSNQDYARKFAQLIKYTEEKHNISLRNENYYLRMLEIFGSENVDIHLTKINLDKLLESVKSEEQANDIKNAYSQIEYSNGIYVVYGCDTAEMYYGASNPLFSNYRPTYYTHYYGMLKAKEKGYKYFNLGGVIKTSDEDGLYQFKRKLGAVNMRFIGEYDYPIKNNVKAKLFNFAKKVYKKVR